MSELDVSRRVPAEDPGEVLDQARAALRSGDWPLALERYEYFFDHALDGDPASYYGVRLSYCLLEWARLGEKYEPAKAHLEDRAKQAMVSFVRTGKPEQFHDFCAISEALGRADDAVSAFLHYHVSDIRQARKLGRYVWRQLVKRELWDICSEHLRAPGKRVDLAFIAFDVENDVYRARGLGEEEAKDSERRLVRSLREVAAVLSRSGRRRELRSIRLRAVKQLEKRSLSSLEASIFNLEPSEG